MTEPFKTFFNDALINNTGERNPADGLAGWVVWSLGKFVVRRGMHEPERAASAARHDAALQRRIRHPAFHRDASRAVF